MDALFSFEGGFFTPGPVILIGIVVWAVWDWARGT
jgi:hypothetical protein